jgi:hypothetical protein
VWNCTYAKAPVPRTDGDRALFSLVLRERIAWGNGYQWGRPCPCRRNALTSSCLPLVYLGLPGSLPVNPLPSVLRMGLHPHTAKSASFRNPLGSRTISMRSVHPDLQSPTTHLARCGAALVQLPSSTSRGRVRMSVSWLQVPASGAPDRPEAAAVRQIRVGRPTSSRSGAR